MDLQEIALQVRQVHGQLWHMRHELYPLGCHPLQLCEPKLAAQLLDYEYLEEPIDDWPPQRRALTAGLVDPQSRRIVISPLHDRSTMRFTGAHEIGHVKLHGVATLLRTRPIEGPRLNQQDRTEREADIFATLFLMPQKQMLEAFKRTFNTEPPIKIDENLAFHISHEDPDEVLNNPRDPLSPMRKFACWRPLESEYKSLHQQFGVSVTAMAIRLKELKFLEF